MQSAMLYVKCRGLCQGRCMPQNMSRTANAVQHVKGGGAGIAHLVVLGLAATVSRVRCSSGDIFR